LDNRNTRKKKIKLKSNQMRVKAGDFQKEIPAKYAGAVKLLTLADWEKPEKVRLTPMERFLFAEAAWRVEQPKAIRDYLEGTKPEQIIEQINRLGVPRHAVRYSIIPNGTTHPQAIVPTWVKRACPKDLFSVQHVNWVE